MLKDSIGYGKKTSVTLLVLCCLMAACAQPSGQSVDRLREWRQGVWMSGTGTYTVYTDDHYFVVSIEGDSAKPNLYCGASQVTFHRRGIARQQVLRLRQVPGHEITLFNRSIFQPDHTEAPLVIDTTLFVPGTCTIADGVIYDAITEMTDEFILLSTCNGDKEKIFSNGVSVYMPAGGGEFYSYRVSRL
ncbi:MAG: hypothetical protein GF341_10995 [candidate division Zixibacteria bacterium]|nr:hypothetical protein [candidate division Zixibacteria bacterium]